VDRTWVRLLTPTATPHTPHTTQDSFTQRIYQELEASLTFEVTPMWPGVWSLTGRDATRVVFRGHQLVIWVMQSISLLASRCDYVCCMRVCVCERASVLCMTVCVCVCVRVRMQVCCLIA
jgi:hypothetical protein